MEAKITTKNPSFEGYAAVMKNNLCLYTYQWSMENNSKHFSFINKNKNFSFNFEFSNRRGPVRKMENLLSFGSWAITLPCLPKYAG